VSTHESADQAGTPQYGTAHSAASAAPHYSAAFGSTSLPGSQPVSAQEYDAVLRRLSAAEATRDNMSRQIRGAGEKNRKLVEAITSMRYQVERLRASLSQNVMPPLNSAIVLAVHEGQTMTYEQVADDKTPAEIDTYLDVQVSGRMMRIPVSPLIDLSTLTPGMTVLLNDKSEAVVALDTEPFGDVVTVREVLDGERVLVDTSSGAQQVARVAGSLDVEQLRTGDAVTLDTRTRMITSQVPASPPKGILLYGPPGNGKTMIAKAVANSLAARAAALNPGSNTRGYFLNIKGPELLDKFVGETERQIRDIFVAAREKAEAGHPVVVFFDEMESLFRMRGSGRSSDIETTIVPQLLAEIDGVESLQNVIVIGATNREDLIDAAVMRPGRLDLKIRINRPDAAGAAEIFGLYLTEDLPLDAAEVAAAGSTRAALTAMIAAAAGQLYARTPSTAYAVATVDSSMVVGSGASANLSTHTLYRGDFASGAVIRNIVDRAKKAAIKEQLQALTAGADASSVGIGTRHLLEAVRAEFEDQVDLPPLPDIEDALTVAGVRGRLVSVEPPR